MMHHSMNERVKTLLKMKDLVNFAFTDATCGLKDI